MKRFGQLIGIKSEYLGVYCKYHSNGWPEVTKMINECNIRNYSIYHLNGLLFAYFEYIGTDLKYDMEKMAADPKTQEWWDLIKPMQEPLEQRTDGEWWADMQEVFHQD